MRYKAYGDHVCAPPDQTINSEPYAGSRPMGGEIRKPVGPTKRSLGTQIRYSKNARGLKAAIQEETDRACDQVAGNPLPRSCGSTKMRYRSKTAMLTSGVPVVRPQERTATERLLSTQTPNRNTDSKIGPGVRQQGRHPTGSSPKPREPQKLRDPGPA